MKKYKAAVLVVSTKGAAGQREDTAGPALVGRLAGAGYECPGAGMVTDDRGQIAAALVRLVDEEGFDLVLTCGGTGLSPSDVTPEATLDIAQRAVPGLAEAMRAASRAITPRADLSRAVAVQRGGSLVINLPGSPKGALENLEVILPALGHGLDKAQGDPRDCAEVR